MMTALALCLKMRWNEVVFEMTEEKVKLLIEIERLSEELQGYINDLKDEVYDAIEEAKEIVDNEQALPDRLIEMRNALNRVTDNQEMSLGI